jgi:hypothetical protein
MGSIEHTPQGWRIDAGSLVLTIDKQTGSLAQLVISGRKDALGARAGATAFGVVASQVTASEADFVWSEHPGQVTVRDDLLRHTFDQRDVTKVWFDFEKDVLTVYKTFRGAPWLLTERYAVDGDAIHWQADVTLDEGDFRSCCISYAIPWPQLLYSTEFWTAKDGMPSAPNRFTGLKLEYGEITSGMLMPVLCSYRADKNAGLLVAMPFDFRSPHFTISSSYRDLDLLAEFDWLALAPGKPARTSLLLHGTGGHWRPALGWLYERFNEYFEPRSATIHDLWGGHISGGCDVAPEKAHTMRQLGMTWHEVHEHFPAYGNYHPEGIAAWRSGHARKWETMISVEMIQRTIDTLHAEQIAALPYIQISGDGDAKLLDPAMYESMVKDRYGNPIYSEYYDTVQLNSDPSLTFGKDITRQIDGMMTRYPSIDGVFLDQACYNWIDTAHDDGITAIDNRPVYMTGFNYDPHLEHLSRLLHPNRSIIANGPYCVSIMKYVDAYMAEGSGWLCDLMQYYGLAKPMFFLMYDKSDRDIELMFQRCLIYAAGFTSYPQALPSKDLYDRYLPLLTRMFRRKWIFDPEPLHLPTGFQGGIFRTPSGSLIASVVGNEPRAGGRTLHPEQVQVCTADLDRVQAVTLQSLDGEITPIPFSKDGSGISFDVPGDTIAAVAELHLE